MKRKKRIKWKNIILLIVFNFFVILAIISIINIFNWIKDNKEMENQIDNITETTEIKNEVDNENTEIIIQDTEIDKENPYWEYIKMNLIDVNIKDLKKQNKDTIGWIQVGGTNINYPFVQTKDNEYYLTHSFNKKYNSAGWVFLDYRNNDDLSNKNNIIYAHSRLDKTMFGSLKNILSNGWLNNKDNHIIKLSTLKENTLWQVFSVYVIPTTTDYLQIDFLNDEEFLTFTTLIKDRSEFDFNTNISASDKVLTLSTCKNDNKKVVLHAKLIKRETKK